MASKWKRYALEDLEPAMDDIGWRLKRLADYCDRRGEEEYDAGELLTAAAYNDCASRVREVLARVK